MSRKQTVGAAMAMAALCGMSILASATVEEKPSTTADNLKAAYQAGSNAKAQYDAFAAKADEEGFKSVAALFRASAKAESIHLAKYAMVLKDLGVEAKADAATPAVKTTAENLDAVAKAVAESTATRLPAFIKQAETDKNSKAVMFFKGAVTDENSRAAMYKKAAADLNGWKEAGKEFLVCLVCAYTTMDTAIKVCPVCSAPRSKFDSFK